MSYKITHPKTGEILIFNSKTDLDKYFGLSLGVFSKRTKEISVQEAFNYYMDKPKQTKIITIIHPETGEILNFKSKKDIARYLKIDYSHLFKKLKENSLQEIFDYYININKTLRAVNPKTGEILNFNSKKEIADYFKISKSSFTTKSNRTSLQEAFNYFFFGNHLKKINIKHPVTGKNLEFNSNSDLDRYFNLSTSQFSNKKKAKNMSNQEAFEYFINNKRKNYYIVEEQEYLEEINDVIIVKYKYKNKKELAKHFNLSENYISNLFNKFNNNYEKVIDYIKNNETHIYMFNLFKIEKNEYFIANLIKFFKIKQNKYSVIERYHKTKDFMSLDDFIISEKLRDDCIFVGVENIEKNNHGYVFIPISRFAKEKGLNIDFVREKLNEGFTYKDF